MAAISNLFIDAGSTFSVILNATDSDGPLNLTGYTVKSQMRKSYRSTVAFDFDATVFSATDGQIQLVLTAAASSAMKPGRYVYDVEITPSGGEPLRILEGVVTISPQVTQT